MQWALVVLVCCTRDPAHQADPSVEVGPDVVPITVWAQNDPAQSCRRDAPIRLPLDTLECEARKSACTGVDARDARAPLIVALARSRAWDCAGCAQFDLELDPQGCLRSLTWHGPYAPTEAMTPQIAQELERLRFPCAAGRTLTVVAPCTGAPRPI